MKKDTLKIIYFTNRLIIFPVVIILSSLILIVFVIYPQTIKLISNFQAEGRLSSKSQVLVTKAQALEEIDEVDLENKLALAMGAYPSERDFSQIIGVLQNIMAKFSFTVVSLHLAGAEQSGQSKALTSFYVNLEIIGPKSMLSSLINGIESPPRIMKVSSIEVSNSVVSDYANVVIRVQVYYQTLPATFGDVDTPLPVLSEKDEIVLAKLTRVPVSTDSARPVSKGRQNPFK